MASSHHILFLSLLLITQTTVLAENQPAQVQDVSYLAPVTKPPTTPAKPSIPSPTTKPPTPMMPVISLPTPPVAPKAPTSPIIAPAPPVVAPPKASAPPVVTPYRPPVKAEECGSLCSGRCKVHSRPGLCVRACSTCCVRCKCVPPGTYGNRELCGKCYTEMRTHGGRFKCP